MKNRHFGTIIKILFLAFLFSINLSQAVSQRFVAEWEPAIGTLIRWPLGIPQELVIKLASGDSLYVLVENQQQKEDALYTFNSWGVNTSNCRFIFTETYSHWTRDWGPQTIFNTNGKAVICDPVFDGYPWVSGCNYTNSNVTKWPMGYEEDDAVNQALGPFFGMQVMSFPLFLTGGNIMTDGQGTAISTRQMLAENSPFCDEYCFRNTCRDSLGLNRYFILENPEDYGLQHIDCHAKFLNEETILVKQLPQSHPEYYCSEFLAESLATLKSCYNKPYRIKRIFCDYYSGNNAAAYTNSLILNKKVFVPLFGNSSDAQAIETYQEAMPGYEIVGIYSSSWYYYDALHCRTMGIFDRGMLRITHKCPYTVPANYEIRLTAYIDNRSGQGLIEDQLLVYWRIQGSPQWELYPLIALPQSDSFQVLLPSFNPGTFIEYYFSAADSSGRTEKQPRVAPAAYYTIETREALGISKNKYDNIDLYQNDNHLIINTNANSTITEPFNIEVYNIMGRLVYKTQTDCFKPTCQVPLDQFSDKSIIFIKVGSQYNQPVRLWKKIITKR